MATLPILGFRGLKTSGNPLTHPPGSLTAATNCVIISKDVIQPRRGHPRGANTFGASDDRARALTEYDGGLVLHYGPSSQRGGDTLAYAATPTGAWSNLSGTSAWDAPDQDTLRMKFAQLARNLYFTSSNGLGVLPGIAGSARLAGVASPPTLSSSLSGNPGAGWFAANRAVAYRCVFGRKDANGNVKLSAAGPREVLVNPPDGTATLTRSGSTVTATFTSTHYFKTTDVIALSPGSADFLAGNYTLTAVTATTVQWTNLGTGAAGPLASQTISSGSKNAVVAPVVPNGVGIVAGDFVRVYRTESVDGVDSDPGDEEFLCYERTLTASNISSRSVVVTDTTPDGFLGEALYSNQNSGKGAAFGKELPPLARDIAVFDNRVFAASTQGPHTLTLRLIGVGAPDGLQTTDFIGIGEKVYPMTTTVEERYTPLINIAETVDSFSVTTSFESNGEFVVSPTATDTLPVGGMLFSRRNLTDGVFYAATSRASAFQDPLPGITAVTEASSSRTSNVVTITTATAHGFATGDSVVLAYENATSEDANFPAGVKTNITVTGASTFTYAETGSNATMTGTYYVFATSFGSSRLTKPIRFSEPGEPEAWPLVNFPGGLPDGDVLRIAPSRGQLFVFYEKGDIYTISGTFPYTVSKYSGSATLIAPDSLVDHAESLHGLTTQGLCRISEGGLEILSRDIEDALRLQQVQTASMRSCFGVSYEMDRQYQCWLGYLGVNTGVCNLAFVYQSDFGAFTSWSAERTCGLSIKNDEAGELLVFGAADGNWLRFESKNYDASQDYFDDTLTFAGCTTLTSTTIDRAGGWSGVSVGDYVSLGPDDFTPGFVTNVAGTVLTFDGVFGFTGDSVVIQKTITPVTLGWVAASAGGPGVEKQWQYVQLHFSASEMKTASISVSGERQSNAQGVNLAVNTFASGLAAESLSTIRAGIPTDAQRQAMVQVSFTLGSYAGTYFKAIGYSLTKEDSTERTPQ